MHLNRREFLYVGLAAAASEAAVANASNADVHQQLLDLAARQEGARRDRFATVNSNADLETLQQSLRQKFLRLLNGFPALAGAPEVKKTGKVEGDDYVVEKLVFESFPKYFVPALLYRPKTIDSVVPGILSPCGHSTTGKAAEAYQILHINLVKRGYVVLTYDPVGQGERSQFWDAERRRSRFNLSCGEHAVLGNPLYLLGSSLARFRIWDGMRGLDYLASLPEVDATRIGCVGNSGGGTLTAYLSALDPRVTVAAICCYITTLPRRMGNRIETDPDADPEQDIFGFVSEGIDHAGLLALRVPRPTLLGTARFDFFPIAGARESFAEAKRLYEVAGAGACIERVEANERHGLTLPLRTAVYAWFDRHLGRRTHLAAAQEIAVTARSADELLVCSDGQVNLTFQSTPLLRLALEEFNKRNKPPRASLRGLLRLDPGEAHAHITEIAAVAKSNQTLVVCINGNETEDWREQPEFLQALIKRGIALAVIDPRGVGLQRIALTVKAHDYSDPLTGVEENLAYNAFLVGKSLLGMRVSDVLDAIAKLTSKTRPRSIVLCGRRDSALTACFAAAVEPAITDVAVEEMLLSFLPLFASNGYPLNASNIVPGLLESFGDISDVLAQIAPRNILVAAGIAASTRPLPNVRIVEGRFTSAPRLLVDWMEH